MNIDISKLIYLDIIFRSLQSGTHISMKGHPKWYTHLQNFLSEYTTLFRSLGYLFEHDHRQFFYFNGGDSYNGASSRSQDITLIVCSLVDYWANQGNNPYEKMEKSEIRLKDLEHILAQNEDVFAQRKIKSIEDMESRLRSMVNNGFMRKTTDTQYEMLPPIFRFIDASLKILDNDEAEKEL